VSVDEQGKTLEYMPASLASPCLPYGISAFKIVVRAIGEHRHLYIITAQ
jgi:hypothetical protein